MEERRDPAAALTSIPVLKWMGMRWVDTGDPDVYVVEMDIRPDLLNLAGVPHGGVIATLIDHTGGFAAGVLTGRGGPTADLHVRYLTGTRGTTLRAEARIVRAGRQLAITETRVFDDTGKLVAIGDMSIAVSNAGEPRTEPSPD